MIGAQAQAPLSPRSKLLSDRAAALHRAKRLLRKFGPFTLVVLLLFGIKYFLVAIYFNLHHVKAKVMDQCDGQIARDLKRDLESAKNEHWAQHKMVGRGAYGFVQWSAYRVSSSQIVAVGFGAAVLRGHREASSCAWHGADGKSLAGEPKLLYPTDKTDQYQYETVIVSCIVPDRVSTHLGGHAAVTLDKEHVVVYREGTDAPVQRDAAGAFKYKASFCTYPVAEAVDGERVREWLEIHKFIGAEHVVAYDAGGFDKNAMEHLGPYMASGFLEVTPMRAISRYNIKNSGKIMAMHDCLYRSTLTSNWVVYLNWDDILVLQSPRFLSILLDDHKDLAFMTYGCRMYSTKMCLDTKSVPGSAHGGFRNTGGGRVPFPYERMVYHWPHFLCTNDKVADKSMCLGNDGMRYLMVNPNKASLVTDSQMVEPTEGGLDLSAEDVRHARFEHIHKEGVQGGWCKETHPLDEKVEWWARGEAVAKLCEDVRKELEGKREVPATSAHT